MIATERSRIAANHQTPWIGVHSLTEFMFCPRAGLLAYETDDTGGQVERPNVRYLPDWNLAAIQQSRREATIRLSISSIALTLLALMGGFQFQQLSGARQLLLLVCIAMLGVAAWRQMRLFCRLTARVRAAKQAVPMMPDAENTDRESVSWWSLLAAGFESVQYKEALRDERLRLAGRPWRVLRNGSLRIPVFRITGEPRLRRQHFARIAAYCHLLETCEGCRSPYGVAIFAGTYDGLTVRNSPGSRKAFHDGLVLARSVVRQSKQRAPAMPTNRNCCLRCPHGYPRTQAKRPFRALTGYARRGTDGRFYNSVCGDRYQWVPPHEKAIRKRLV
jgi:hypothetical protein